MLNSRIMSDIIIDNHKKILPVPIPFTPAPSSPEGLDKSLLTQAVPLNPYPNIKNDKKQYCNQLPPAPRSQDLNVPYQGPECPYSNILPYEKDACYLTANEGQGVVGLVCNSPGGSDNANFARGNQFGLYYNGIKQSDQFKHTEKIYKEHPPVQLAMDKPFVVYDKNTFYPQPDWNLQKDPNYQTYMHPQQFTPNGLPTYTFPDQVLNPMKPLSQKEYVQKMDKKEATNDPVISDYPNNVPYPDFDPNIQLDLQDRNLSVVQPKQKDTLEPTHFVNDVSCPHKKNCPYCSNCPFGPNCQCGRRCPYCMQCSTIKSVVLDNFQNQAVEAFENQNKKSHYQFVVLMFIFILLFFGVAVYNKYFRK